MAWGRSVSTLMAVTEATFSAKYLYAKSSEVHAYRLSASTSTDPSLPWAGPLALAGLLSARSRAPALFVPSRGVAAQQITQIHNTRTAPRRCLSQPHKGGVEGWWWVFESF
jgi:hypothetical protein